MKQSNLFTKTKKNPPQDADSKNAKLLIQGGFIDQLASGIYSFLPLGLRSLRKVKDIIREEMNDIGGQEILMPAIHPKEIWEQTDRWNEPGEEVMFQFEGRSGKEYGLGWSHEEVITRIAQKHSFSYRDLPFSVYQIQDKFRNEPRAKSGLLRGLEFSMKDMYSFHLSEDGLEDYYETVADSYGKIFKRCGLDSIRTRADGGSFSKFSDEFQVITENGEDTIYTCNECSFSQNSELGEFEDGSECPECSGAIEGHRAIEVGNIFKLKTKYSDAFDFTVTGEDGKENDVYMGCYGIGPSRVLGSIVEVHHDDNGIVWPSSVAPFHVHLVSLSSNDSKTQDKINKKSEQIYNQLKESDIEVLWDDRANTSAGEKFAVSDLLGMPIRLVISKNTLEEEAVELSERSSDEENMIPYNKLEARIQELI
ncbi:MAG: proline--tRNA ligase [Candidatus Paceibacteria bacterium]